LQGQRRWRFISVKGWRVVGWVAEEVDRAFLLDWAEGGFWPRAVGVLAHAGLEMRRPGHGWEIET
jgi:hypothetical protein